MLAEKLRQMREEALNAEKMAAQKKAEEQQKLLEEKEHKKQIEIANMLPQVIEEICKHCEQNYKSGSMKFNGYSFERAFKNFYYMEELFRKHMDKISVCLQNYGFKTRIDWRAKVSHGYEDNGYDSDGCPSVATYPIYGPEIEVSWK